MICYKDMTFCVAECGELKCPRNLTDQVKADAEAWWGSKDAPIAVSDFRLECDMYKPVSKEVDQCSGL